MAIEDEQEGNSVVVEIEMGLGFSIAISAGGTGTKRPSGTAEEHRGNKGIDKNWTFHSGRSPVILE